MARPQPERHRRADPHANISALQRVPVAGIRPLPVGVEVVREQGVIEARPRARQRRVSMSGPEVAAIGAEAKLRYGGLTPMCQNIANCRHLARQSELAHTFLLAI